MPSAIKPNKFFSAVFKGEKEIGKAEPTVEEKILAAGAKTAFWKTLKGIMEEVAANLDQINEAMIAKGASHEEIGENAVVISLSKGVIKRIIDKVQDAKQEG